MYKVSTSGATCTVSRTLDLAKTGQLQARKIDFSSMVKIDVSKTDQKTDVGKKAVQQFESVYKANLQQVMAKADVEDAKAWEKLAADIEKAVDTAEAKLLVGQFQKDVADRWNTLAKAKDKIAESSWSYVVKDLAKTYKTDLAKITKISFLSDTLTPQRLQIETSILAALTIGVSVGFLGGLAFVVAGVGILIKGYTGAWEIAKKTAREIDANLDQIDSDLEKVNKSMESLEPKMKAVMAAREAHSAQILATKDELKTFRKKLADLESKAKAEKSFKGAGDIQKVRESLARMESDITELNDKVEAMDVLYDAFFKARQAVSKVNDISTSSRKGWDAFMTKSSKKSDDHGTALDAISKIFDKIGAL